MIDNSPTSLELIREVHRLIEAYHGYIVDRYGPIPDLRSPQWSVAQPGVQLAALLPLAEAWLIHNPERMAVEQLKAMSGDLSAAHDWSAASRRPSHAERQRRRGEPGPLAAMKFDPEAARRWVETGSSDSGGGPAT